MSRRGRPPLAPVATSYVSARSQRTAGSFVNRSVTYNAQAVGRESHVRIPAVKVKRTDSDYDGQADQWTQWEPGESAGDVADDEEEYEEDGLGNKRKRYASSDDPMGQWRQPECRRLFMEEVARLHGLGYALRKQLCASCQVPAVTDDQASTLHRCRSCGYFVECETCCLKRHETLPLHRIEKWTQRHWEPTSLRRMGLRYQLGHGGLPCLAPNPTTEREFVVIHTNGIHYVLTVRCGCEQSTDTNDVVRELIRMGWYPATRLEPRTCATLEVLEQCRLLKVVGGINIRDFTTTVESLTDPIQESKVPERYDSLNRMARQYSYMLRVKRSGRMHEESGVEGTREGELAVRCWACPEEGVNLPQNWKEVNPIYRFVFTLFLAVDANFRMKSRLIRNAKSDPPLAAGLGYFVEPEKYREHLKNYVSEQYISSCIAFKALAEKDTKLSMGMRVSGVVRVCCARHGILRPTGLGDLQKGERYSNVDYVVWSVLALVFLFNVLLCYDIGCQYKLHLSERRGNLPEHLKEDERQKNTTVQVALPVWHGTAHEVECEKENSVRYQDGAGAVDGEAMERLWALLNILAYMTKVMSAGNREDTLEDKLDHVNFNKNISLCKYSDTLQQKYKLALDEREKACAYFDHLSSTLEDATIGEWTKLITEWNLDHSKQNPYHSTLNEGMTEREVKKQLREDEAKEAQEGKRVLYGTSATHMLFLGTELESEQRRIRSDVKNLPSGAINRQGQIEERRIRFFHKLQDFRDMQTNHMPGGIRAVTKEEEGRDGDSPSPQAEDVALWMPSQLEPPERTLGCAPGLVGMEARIRDAQCREALRELRQKLHAKAHLISFRNAQLTGQRDTGRARGQIEELGVKINLVVAKYRASRSSLRLLRGKKECAGFRELLDEDVRLNEEEPLDAATMIKLGRLGSERSRLHAKAAMDKRRKLSWIWTSMGGPGENDEKEIHEAVRVEWCKAFARRKRWREEVMILVEEMRRVLRSLDWKIKWWVERTEVAWVNDDVLRSGLTAYAVRQVQWLKRVRERFKWEWENPSAIRVRRVAVRGLEELLEFAPDDEIE